MNITANTTISWKRDMLGLIEIPVKAGIQQFDAIFDTRANMSSISATYAKKLGLHILDVSYDEGSGITGIRFKTGIGVADSLYIGKVLVKNAVFQVMPDSILYIAPVKFQLNIIIGMPVIEQLHEVQVYSNGKMVVPLIPSKSNLRNLAFDGLDAVISLRSGNDTLSFHFDSGAGSSVLYAAYFDKYKSTVLKQAVKKHAQFGGAGGSQKKEIYVLPAWHLTLGDKAVTVDSVSVLTNKIYPSEKYYGNLGQDLMKKFSVMTFNFTYMYVKGN
jgi:hypothetical protein